jgi:transcriptional regulator with XRE-family HTH domain
MPRTERSPTLADMIAEGMRPDETLAQLAARASVDAKTLWRLRYGHVQRPTIGTLALLAIALRRPLGELRRAAGV